jgi:hypothetical protein
MCHIYNLATRVCIWLGDPDPQTKEAMQFINKVVDLSVLPTLVHADYTLQWSALAHLMTSPWFGHRWIIQELAFAREATVHCGDDIVHWDDMKDAIGLFDKHYDIIKEFLKEEKKKQMDRSFQPIGSDAVGELEALGAKVLVDYTVNIFRKASDSSIEEPTMTLEMLLSTLSGFDTADPRDTINCLRNISREVPWMKDTKAINASAEVPPPVPDYTKSLLTVYTEFLEWHIKKTRSLDLLCRHWAIPEKEKQEPITYPILSLLPTYIKTIKDSPWGSGEQVVEGQRRNGDSFVGIPGRGPYNASHGIQSEASFNEEDVFPRARDRIKSISCGDGDPSLYVRGLEIDVVSWLSGQVAAGVIPQEAIEKCGWDNGKKREALNKGAVVKVPDKLWRALVADRSPDGSRADPLYHRACLHVLIHHTPGDHINVDKLLEQSRPGVVKNYLKRVQAVVENRRFLESKRNGLIGICPKYAQLGDKVCILFGCSVPVILREKRDETGIYFEFIGEAFVYGKMDGEAITALGKDLKKHSKVFRLL